MKLEQPHPAEPSASELGTSLGAAHAAFQALLRELPDLRPEWKYYGAKAGWSLKLFAGKRNLCFLLPKDGHFVAAFVFGERAAAAVLAAETVPRAVKDELESARRYAEGRGVRVTVTTAAELPVVHTLLALKQG